MCIANVVYGLDIQLWYAWNDKSMVKEEQETSLKLASIYYSYGLDCWCKWLRFIVHIFTKTYCNLNGCCYWKPRTQFDTLYIIILQHCFQLICSCAQTKEVMGLTYYIIPSACIHTNAKLSLACKIVCYLYMLHFVIQLDKSTVVDKFWLMV